MSRPRAVERCVVQRLRSRLRGCLTFAASRGGGLDVLVDHLMAFARGVRLRAQNLADINCRHLIVRTYDD